MTRARALKAVIRARAAKTGERYTTARRHVLEELRARPEQVASPGAKRAPATRTAAAPATTKGGLSDAKSLEKTGHGLAHWFAVLDRFAAVEKGHTASARHLHGDHSVPGWYAQGITVAYERARGVRAVNQRCDGEYEVTISKVAVATPADVVKALTTARGRKRWTADVDPALAKGLARAVDDPSSKGVIVRADGQARFRYKWGDTTVQLNLLPKPGGKLTIVITHGKLTDGAMVEQRRALWRTALDAIARSLARSG